MINAPQPRVIIKMPVYVDNGKVKYGNDTGTIYVCGKPGTYTIRFERYPADATWEFVSFDSWRLGPGYPANKSQVHNDGTLQPDRTAAVITVMDNLQQTADYKYGLKIQIDANNWVESDPEIRNRQEVDHGP